ncbi:class II aldolase/adducin family protein [Tsuneonella sp. CC-YZS046]|uniref:class II aldolase/adducin family protein n=1 Tax=Tsuneonella sp. CC-YZS046 TaxID=3042152 RepID=UPI002D792B4E|nr:class II aldolase/adducin family protein [Tsuneonella sp. CC-YZS046]WRO65461.1 class II aldolase/adducin family protein [Tsuneonella sp. CC-YZS046]
MSQPHNILAAHRPASMRERVSEEEWAARVELAALYRILHHFGMTDLIANHITMRVPDGSGHILINAYGLTYDEVTASNLYKITIDGDVVLKPDVELGLNPTGYTIHGAVHRAREDAHVVIHTHSAAGTGVSGMKCGLLPLSQHAALVERVVGYHDYEGVALNFEERERLVANLGSGNLLILRNHGLLACGRTCGEAFLYLYRLEMACKIQVAALAGGLDNGLAMSGAALENTRNIAIANPGLVGGDLQWKALLRRMDRIDPSYKE